MSEPKDTPAVRYFEKVPCWPNFASTGEMGGGRVPATKLDSWRDIAKIIEEPFFKRQKTQLVFRGSRRFDWSLTPSLGRLDSRGIITQEVANAQLKLFRHAIRGRISDHTLVDIDDENTKELWSVGQHHGLHTPLLDWSYSIYVALFFAFADDDASEENPFRAIYVLNKTHVEHDGHCPEVTIVEPRKDDHGRLVNQAGLFTLSAYGDTFENVLINSLQDEVLGEVDEDKEDEELARYLCKIYIPNKDRDECLRHLRMMNVHYASLFPDLIGAASYCNSLVAEFSKSTQEEQKVQVDAIAQVQPLVEELQPVTNRIAPPTEIIFSVLLKHAGISNVQLGDSPSLVLELAEVLRNTQLPDWDRRESILASMRTATRAVLRRHDYPVDLRDALVDALIEALPRPPREEGEVLE
ncbi:FRG domain-containing protein [Uliginosibacterium sp. TH139]|uniref:FRG domain-containing protein n=1 Tax=Uliginosibacterium sp. TH139 TaxID=2067453 RepID=UPI000C7D98C5|nr:FRG domain-containing protein [Uliginosibacterium sp. TH139]PLK50441.1 hypothetical protein C0V76_01010 [Uliginosibacterium sp. TH139]